MLFAARSQKDPKKNQPQLNYLMNFKTISTTSQIGLNPLKSRKGLSEKASMKHSQNPAQQRSQKTLMISRRLARS